MRKLALFVLLVVCIISTPFAARHGKGRKSVTAPTVTITPDAIGTTAPAPTVCIEGFAADSYVNVMVPQMSYGFMPTSPRCNTPDYELHLDAGVYDVPVMVCDYTPPFTLTNCLMFSAGTLTVQ